MKPDQFPGLVQRFFADYLAAQRNLSVETRTGYRTTFRLLLRFLSQHQRCHIDQLTLGAFTPEAILAFLDHLERSRGNSIQTRNVRLAAIRTFVRFVLGQSAALDFLASGQRILAIPQKRCAKRVLGFMTREEIDAIFAATAQNTWSGRRDLLLFMLLYNTGARISEALKLRPIDLRERSVQLHGKGRKQREIPVREIQYRREVLVAVSGVLARRWIARRGRTGEVGCEGAVAVGFAAWWGSPELRASIPAMLCYATSRVGRGRGLLGLTPPQPQLRSFPELPALAAFG